jgi:hypothetical protein
MARKLLRLSKRGLGLSKRRLSFKGIRSRSGRCFPLPRKIPATDHFTELLRQVQTCLDRHHPIPCCAQCRFYGTETCAYHDVNNNYSGDG